MPPEDAALSARLLVRTELRGVESHGVRWIANYCRALRDGKMNPQPQVTIAVDTGSLLLVDGDGGLGHVVSWRAMEFCLSRATQQGAAFAAVRNSRHNGAASLYALQAMEAGMIGLAMTGGGVRVAPAGGSEAMLGTNPIAFAAPADTGPPFVLDMATSVVAGARVTLQAQKGQSIPPGWGLDPEGRPTTDAAAAERGALLPLGSMLELGSYKGFALGLIVETLCNLLPGTATGPERVRGLAGGAEPGAGHFLGAIRLEGLQDPQAFRERLSLNLQLLRDSRPQEGVEHIFTPGELEWRREQDRETNGCPVLGATVQALQRLAGELGVEGLP